MAVLRDADHVFLDVDPVTGRHVLGSLISLERRPLPAGTFELILEEGDAFIFRHEDDDGDIAPVGDFLQLEVLQTPLGDDPVGDREIVWKDGSKPSSKLSALCRRRSLRTLAVRLPPTDLVLRLPCACFARPRPGTGCRLMFSLQGLHSALNLSQFDGRSSVWASHQWHVFARLLASSWSLGLEHLLKSRPYRHHDSDAGAPDPDRTLPYHAVSTYAMMCLLFQWGFRSHLDGGFGKDNDVCSVKSVLEGLLRGVGDQRIALCETVDWTQPWPRFVWQGFSVAVEISGGVLQLGELQERPLGRGAGVGARPNVNQRRPGAEAQGVSLLLLPACLLALRPGCPEERALLTISLVVGFVRPQGEWTLSGAFHRLWSGCYEVLLFQGWSQSEFCPCPFTRSPIAKEAATNGSSVAHEWLRLLYPDHDMPWPTLFEAVSKLGDASRVSRREPLANPLAQQLLRAAALSIDQALANKEVVSPGQEPPDKLFMAGPTGQSMEAYMNEQIAGHLAAARDTVARTFESVKGFSMTNDDSTVRSQELSNTAVILTTNVGIWAPTQAPPRAGQGQGESRTTRN